MAKMFWKKLVLLNIGLLITLFRLYSLFLSKVDKFKNFKSVFPSEDENGYPFFDQIHCNLKNLFLISHSLSNFSSSQEQIQLPNSADLKKCDFYQRLLICSGNAYCERNLMSNSTLLDEKSLPTTFYHKQNLDFNGILFWNKIYELNYFTNTNKEMDFFYKVLSGYHTYVNLFLVDFNDPHYETLKTKVTSSYDRLNNLFYFLSLLIKSELKINKNFFSYSTYNEKDLNHFCDECLKFSEDNIQFLIDSNSRETIDEVFNVLSEIKKIFSCIPDEEIKKSAIVDIDAIDSMFKILFYGSPLDTSKENFEYLVQSVIKKVDAVFHADFDVKTRALKYTEYDSYGFILFIGITIVTLTFMNKYFIQNKEKFESRGRLFGTKKGRVDQKKINFLEKSKELTKKEEDFKKALDSCPGIPISELSPEEREYVDILTKKSSKPTEELKSEFVVTKN